MKNKKKQTPRSMIHPEKWNLTNLPPAGNEDVGGFVQNLYEEAIAERERVNITDRWKRNYELYRNRHWSNPLAGIFNQQRQSRLSLNILGANIQRTVANITARAPISEVKAADGFSTEADEIMSQKMRKWSHDEKQMKSLTTSVNQQEIYGITFEKGVYDRDKAQAYPVVVDPYALLLPPGNWRELNDAPYLIHLYAMDVDAACKKYNVDPEEVGIEAEDLYSILGGSREDVRTEVPAGTSSSTTNAPGNHTPVKHPEYTDRRYRNRCLVQECWIRDWSTYTEITQIPVVDPETGEILQDPNTGDVFYEEQREERYRYPGGIRVITTTNQGHVVLDDRLNPNINPELPHEIVQNTYLFDRFPFHHSNSYEDTDSVYGFSMAEMVGDINLSIDDLWSQIMAYLRMMLFPPLILPKDTGISPSKIRYRPRLILQPNSYQTSLGIRFLEMPSPPSWMFEALSTLLMFFDRISQIEDADRGDAPKGVVAASAIQMLQERGAVLIRAKIRAVDHLVRERGRHFISFFQNFGVEPETLDYKDQLVTIRGIDMSQYQFNYIVESGSTVAKTESQERQEAYQLFQMGAIDKQALLEKVRWEGWREVIERMGERDLDMALNILIQSGMPEETAMELRQWLMQPQGGPGAGSQGSASGEPGAPPQAGVPKASQGGGE